MNKALLIIDMQKGSFTSKTPRYDTDGVVARINGLAQCFRNLNYPVIVIQHDGTGSGSFEKGAADWENLDALNLEPTDVRIDKYVNDVFYKSDLQSRLEQLEASELYISGCATDFCVEATVQSALTKGYSITVIKDGHTTGERPQLSAKQVIDHYNWTWQNMIPITTPIHVLDTDTVLKGLVE